MGFKNLLYEKFFPENEPKGIVQISHGLVEYKRRYYEFINYLTEKNFAVYINDHYGFGENRINDVVGSYERLKVWERLVDDMFTLNSIIRKENPNKKVILLGHSMGSMLSRRYIQRYEGVDGVILSGANGKPFINELLALLISLFETTFFGRRHLSKTLFYIQFGTYNSYFKDRRTLFEWLSTDREKVLDYKNDPYCGIPVSSAFFMDMILGYFRLSKIENVKKVKKDLPILFISGKDDPVGNFGKGVLESYNLYKKVGLNNVSIKFYDGKRHEILNESGRKEIYDDIIFWIKKNVLEEI
jgi:alpha-beta hydrolase superfamily lysophospholipase